jgi:hypothetical protein
MDGTDEPLEIPEGTEFEVNDLWLDFADAVEADEGTMEWLAQNDLPATVEGVDYSLDAAGDGGEALA